MFKGGKGFFFVFKQSEDGASGSAHEGGIGTEGEDFFFDFTDDGKKSYSYRFKDV